MARSDRELFRGDLVSDHEHEMHARRIGRDEFIPVLVLQAEGMQACGSDLLERQRIDLICWNAARAGVL